MNTDPDDIDIGAMRRLRDGDDLALNGIMERWTPRVSAFLERYLGGDPDALDLTQETFVAVYRARHSYRPTSAFPTWLFGIAANLARQRLRWRQRHPSAAGDIFPEETGSIREPGDPAADAIASERAVAVRAAIMELPDDLREAVVLSEYENLSHAEIAVIAKCSPKAIETRLYRAREILRKKLARWLV